MIAFLTSQAILIAFNIVNSRLDAYRIIRHKPIAHGVNFTAYAVCTGLCVWIFGSAALTLASAFFNRQLFFDIPLNIRRDLPWDYQSKDNPPKAWWDRVERKLFGNLAGRWIAVIYAGSWLTCIIIKTLVWN